MQKNTHQAHVMIGTRAYDVNDDRRMPLYLLNNMLGGPGMNAKLNLALREHNGLGLHRREHDGGLWRYGHLEHLFRLR